jgi:hypothetical protein
MRKANVLLVLGFLAVLLSMSASRASAQDGQANVRLRGYDEVPALTTGGGALFHATVEADAISYELTYNDAFRGKVLQSHIHFGQRGVNGGIVVFLCTNLGNGPAGTQACPDAPASITGTIHASDITGAASQGLVAGDLAGLERAIRAGIAYVNIHSDVFPGGEIRGQLVFTPNP